MFKKAVIRDYEDYMKSLAAGTVQNAIDKSYKTVLFEELYNFLTEELDEALVPEKYLTHPHPLYQIVQDWEDNAEVQLVSWEYLGMQLDILFKED